jgi:hypothetical protein
LAGGSLEYGSVEGESFDGIFDGDVIISAESEPRISGITNLFTSLDSMLLDLSIMVESTSDDPITIDSSWFSGEHIYSLVSHRPIDIVDAGLIPDGSEFLSTGAITIRGKSRSDFALFYGAAGVTVDGTRELGGQFISKSRITFSGAAAVPYPSTAVLLSEPSVGQIVLASGASFDGTLIFEPTDVDRIPQHANILVSDDAIARGAIFNGAATEVGGEVIGSVVTKSFYFYSSPSTYVNWLYDSTIAVHDRPSSFLLPVSRGIELRPIQTMTDCIPRTDAS